MAEGERLLVVLNIAAESVNLDERRGFDVLRANEDVVGIEDKSRLP